MRCLSCKHLDLKHNAQMSRHGFGHCKKGERSYVHVSIKNEREYASFEEVDQATVGKRSIWMDK